MQPDYLNSSYPARLFAERCWFVESYAQTAEVQGSTSFLPFLRTRRLPSQAGFRYSKFLRVYRVLLQHVFIYIPNLSKSAGGSSPTSCTATVTISKPHSSAGGRKCFFCRLCVLLCESIYPYSPADQNGARTASVSPACRRDSEDPSAQRHHYKESDRRRSPRQ